MSAWRQACYGLISLLLAGCQSAGYLAHLGQGQWQMLQQRQPVQALITHPDTPPTLVRKLESLQQIRAFAGTLDLPASGQFDTYVDIHRPYALWSVQATPELSLQARSWCYWFIGCLSYRNFFDEARAEAFARKQQQQGDDTHIGRVAAYSTLGWFRDSLLSSQLNRREADLAELVFHELAHQVVYAKDDPVFNESFAEVVAQEGLRRYLAGRPNDLAAVLKRLERQHRFAELVRSYRSDLQQLYQSAGSVEEKRAEKKRILAAFQSAYRQLKASAWPDYGGYDAWVDGVNNARLNSVSVYHDLTPSLNALLASAHADLPVFYDKCRDLARLTKAERYRVLGYTQSQVELIHD
ncbi:MAG TPA: aminopeptidase [Fluviicoccus sp.]|nr:aminopeptidase [Fluviicoccus sp.]